MYYPCTENKGADQLRGYCDADLCFCFRICSLLVFSRGGSNDDDFGTISPTLTYSFFKPCVKVFKSYTKGVDVLVQNVYNESKMRTYQAGCHSSLLSERIATHLPYFFPQTYNLFSLNPRICLLAPQILKTNDSP